MAKKKKGSSTKGKVNDARGYATTSSSSKVIPPPATTTVASVSALTNTPLKPSKSRGLHSSAVYTNTTSLPSSSSLSSSSDRLVITPEIHQASLDLLRALYNFNQQLRQGDNPTTNPVESYVNDRPPLLWMKNHHACTDENHDGYIDSTKLRRRLGTIYDTLTQYGFLLHQIVDCISAISSCCNSNYITLTYALDWLCYTLPSAELPSLFTEAILRDGDEKGEKKKSGVTFIFASSKESTSEETKNTTIRVDNSAPNFVPLDGQAKDDQVSNKSVLDSNDSEEWRKAHNAYLIAQYQYQYDDDGGSDDDHIDIDTNKKILDNGNHQMKPFHMEDQTTRGVDNTVSASDSYVEMNQEMSNLEISINEENRFDTTTTVLMSTQSTIQVTNSSEPVMILSDDETRLQGMKLELQEWEDDSKNDANNYMRSKQEVKELKNRISQFRKQICNLEAKIARQRINENQAAMAVVNTTNIDDEDEGGIFSMFDEDNTSAGQLQTKNSPNHEAIGKVFFSQDAIPLNWTGTTPTEYLEELCRREKHPRPNFNKLPKNGCQLSVKRSNASTISFEEQGPYSNYKFVQNYLSIKVLYEMKQTLSLHRIFPPFYRDLWLTWQNDVKQRLQFQAMLLEESRQKVIDELLEIVCLRDKSCLPTNGNAVGPFERNSQQVSKQASEPTIGPHSKNSNPDKGKKLKESFLLRIQSAQYQRLLSERKNLPIYKRREQILEAIQSNPVTILCAETGSGKTTQCCSFILENALREGNGDKTSILCTQPRRVAALSVAERVSEEWGEDSVGKLVGYQIRMEAKRNSETRILFCTTGVILRRLIDDKELNGISHVVVDEVHERQWQIDILLVALRALVNGPRSDLKVILMSATLDKVLFGSFFIGAPMVDVPGRTFPVRTFYLEDLLEHTSHVIEEGSRCADRSRTATLSTRIQVSSRQGTETHEYVASDEVSEHFLAYSLATRKSIDRVDETIINYDLIEDILIEICLKENPMFAPLPLTTQTNVSTVGSVLIFLPGIGEIRTLKERLSGSKTFGDVNRFNIVPLHSSLSASEQKRAFVTSTLQRRKIILSTNIAETSVTIPDVVYVIDSGRFREITRDRRYDSRKLVVSWCSRASAKQRAGRAGRVQPGVCLKLYSSRTEGQKMKQSIEPELQRIPLEEVCLTILAGKFGVSCASFLSQTPQPPSVDAVRSALLALEAIGAIKACSTSLLGPNIVQNESLTPLGRLLSKLPVDARVGKMLILGSIFHCTDSIVTIAATLSASKSPFAASFEDRQEVQALHSPFFMPFSDFVTYVNVWNAYQQAESVGDGRKFCQNKKLNYSTMVEIKESRCHFLDLLTSLGFIDVTNRRGGERGWMSEEHNRNGACDQLIHAIVCAGMFPNVGFYAKNESKSNSYVHHKSEQLFLQSSVNTKLTTSPPSNWIVYSEKFGTERRVFISNTAFIPPISLIIFGSLPHVMHTERKVSIDNWIELSTAASTAVTFREIQTRLCDFLSSVYDDYNRMKHSGSLSDNIEVVICCVGRLFPDCTRI